jgi:hypothetical protein
MDSSTHIHEQIAISEANGAALSKTSTGKREPQWHKPIRKVVYTLDIDNYQPAIKALTFPLMKAYCDKIGAVFHPITERKFPNWPIVYEKLQIFELGKTDWFDCGIADWNIFFDADALISPEMFDPTDHISKDTVLFNGKDMSGIRWKADQYFRRDGRWIGACNWFACASDWCLDLWRPLEDLTLEEALQNIHITIQEHNSGMFRDNHLIDDYTLSRNISRYGLRHDTLIEICGRMGWKNPQTGVGHSPYLFHLYAINEVNKINRMLDVLSKPLEQGGWALMSAKDVLDFKHAWKLQ